MSDRAAAENESLGRKADFDAISSLISSVFARQSELPQLIAAEQHLLRSIIDSQATLGGDHKSLIFAAVVRSPRVRCIPFWSGFPSALDELDPYLQNFTSRLFNFAPFVSNRDVDELLAAGLDEPAILGVVAAVAIGQFFRTLAKGLGLEIVAAAHRPLAPDQATETLPDLIAIHKPYLPIPALEPDALRLAYASVREQFGFVPNLYRTQSYCPKIVEAEVDILESILFPEDHLSRTQKEQIIIRLASSNLDSYLVSLHSQMLALLGTSAAECDQIIDDVGSTPLPQSDKVLLEELSKLSLVSSNVRDEVNGERLRESGFTDAQIVEGVVMAAFTNFLSTVQFGLGPLPDFPPRRFFDPKHLYLFGGDSRPSSDELSIGDPDLELVARIRDGETEMFADLVRQHTRRVFGTLLGIVGNVDDARDSTQEVFLRAYQNIASFQGRSKFSTWLMSIAVNTGTELLRQRRPTESLDEPDDEREFRPRQIQSWGPNPEQQIAKSQMKDLVRRGVERLPQKYRVAVLLRDINQLSTEEAAAALSLSIPATKARVLRGRLMLRESLAPYFARPQGGVDV
jgi:RNA polymerase sigma-70 factor (ECF subfamily)